MKIIQFLPYFPPHKGGLETHAYQWAKYFSALGFGESIVLVNDIEQLEYAKNLPEGNRIYADSQLIGYLIDGIKVYLLPSFEIVPNFPFPKFWDKKYKLIMKLAQEFTADIVVSRTRFFVSSLMAGIFARKNKIKRVHIEHGSGYVKLSSKFSSFCAWTWDKLIGKRIFKNSDLVVPISNACKTFIEHNFVNRKMTVIYRGLEFPQLDNKIIEFYKSKFAGKIIIGYVGRLYKWKNVSTLIKAYYLLPKDLLQKTKLIIVGDGEDLDELKSLDKDNIIEFTGGKSFVQAYSIQSIFDIHVHSSLPGGGLSSSLLQALYLGNFILATPNEGADEVIQDQFNGILIKGNNTQDFQVGLIDSIDLLKNKQQFAIRNKNIIKEQFNWTNSMKLYVDLFKGIVQIK